MATASISQQPPRTRRSKIEPARRAIYCGPERLERVRELVMRYGWNATAYQLLNPGIRHWLPKHGPEAVVGYVPWGDTWVVAGAPVCDEDELDTVVRAFEKRAAAQRRRVVYFGAAGRMISYCEGRGDYASMVLGSQPVWRPQAWAGIVDSHASLRSQLNRARNKGLTVTEWSVEQAHDNPQLWRVLREWLRTRGLPPLHFLVEPETLEILMDRRVWVAEKAGKPVGFVVTCPVPARNGWLTEQFVRGRDAPNGAVELMLDTAIRALAADGAEYVTMGLVPLSTLGAPPEHNPLLMRFILGWVRLHGQRFYNFNGLEHFKAKFYPQEWEPIWVVSREKAPSVRTLWAVAGAFGQQSPLRLMIRGIRRAIRQEYQWATTPHK